MKKMLAAVAFALAVFAAPLSAFAAFDFQVTDSSHTYVSADQDMDTLVTASQYYMPCNQLAEDVGLDESQEYWCLQRLNINLGGGDWGCIILCMVGAGPVWLNPPGYPSGGVGGPNVTGTFIYNERPPGMTASEYQAYQTGPYYLDEPEELGYQVCGTHYNSFPWSYTDCELFHHEPQVELGPVSAWIDANPLSVPVNGTSNLTWGSENATSCTGTNFTTNGATSGTLAVTLTATTTYTVNCVNDEGSATDSVTVVVAPAALAASCAASPASVGVGQAVTWTATASGGTGTYAYSWTGTDSLSGTSASVSKSYSTTGLKYATTTVTSGGQTVTRGCTAPVSVGAPNVNLTAGAITPATGTVDELTTYRSTITNIGTASATSTFTVLFQRSSNAAGTGATSVGTTALLGPLAGNNATLQATMPITWTEADEDSVVYLRACADRPTSRVFETDESDASNCGPWTPISIEACNPSDPECEPESDALACSYQDANDDGVIEVSENVTFSASPSNLGNGEYVWDPSVGATVTGNSTYTRNFTVEGEFQMDVTAPDEGYTQAGTCSFTVGDPDTCEADEVEISAAPDRVKKGTTTTLEWDIPSTPDDSCRITSSADSTWHIDIPINSCVPSGGDSGSTHAIQSQTTFTLDCDGERDTVVVNVFPVVDEY